VTGQQDKGCLRGTQPLVFISAGFSLEYPDYVKIKETPCKAESLRVPLVLPCGPAVGADHCVAIKSLPSRSVGGENHRIYSRPNVVGLCRKQVEGERFAAVRRSRLRATVRYWFGRSRIARKDVRSSIT
jgi:hypothetical protein